MSGDIKTVFNRKGGRVFATPEAAARARAGRVERRRLRRDAMERAALEGMARVVDLLPPERVKAYAARLGDSAELIVWAYLVELQARKAMSDRPNSTTAAIAVMRAIRAHEREELIRAAEAGIVDGVFGSDGAEP